MPAAVLVAGLVAIALAFAAISAILLIRYVCVDPIKAAAAAASEVALIGGILSWLMYHLAGLIEATFEGVNYFAEVGKQQAANWWNYLVNQTVIAQFWAEWGAVHWLQANGQAIANVLNYFPALWSYTVNSLAPSLAALASDFYGLVTWMRSVQIPWIQGIGDDLAGLHRWIDTVELPIIRGIGDDLAGLHRWIDQNVALRREVAQSEAAIASAAAAATAVAVEAIQAIERSPCMRFCEPLGEIGQLIQGLEDAGMLAILLALIEETRRDPHGVQAVLRSVVVPIVHDAADGIGLG